MNATDFGIACTLWTARLSVLLYAVAVLNAVRQRADVGDQAGGIPADGHSAAYSVYRWAWLGAWLMCVVHVICAFHFIHRWNSTAAWQHTADMTERVVGLSWGGGLYINYLFLTWWGIDAVMQFRRPKPSWLMHTVAAFMMFNATVVFGPGWWILPAGLLIVGLAVIAVRSRNPPHQRRGDAVEKTFRR